MVDLGCELDLGRLERVVRREVEVPVNMRPLMSTLHQNLLPLQTIRRSANAIIPSSEWRSPVCRAPIPHILYTPFFETLIPSSAIYLQEEDTTCVRTVTGTHDGRLPLEEVVADRSSRA